MTKYIIKLTLPEVKTVDQVIAENRIQKSRRHSFRNYSHIHIVGKLHDISVVIVDPEKTSILNNDQLSEYAVRTVGNSYIKFYFKIIECCNFGEVFVLNEDQEKCLLAVIEARDLEKGNQTPALSSLGLIPLEGNAHLMVSSYEEKGQLLTFGRQKDILSIADAHLNEQGDLVENVFVSQEAHRNLISETSVTLSRIKRRNWRHSNRPEMEKIAIAPEAPELWRRLAYDRPSNMVLLRQPFDYRKPQEPAVYKPLDIPIQTVTVTTKPIMLMGVRGTTSVHDAEENHRRLIVTAEKGEKAWHQKQAKKQEEAGLPRRGRPPKPKLPVEPRPYIPGSRGRPPKRIAPKEVPLESIEPSLTNEFLNFDYENIDILLSGDQ